MAGAGGKRLPGRWPRKGKGRRGEEGKNHVWKVQC